MGLYIPSNPTLTPISLSTHTLASLQNTLGCTLLQHPTLQALLTSSTPERAGRRVAPSYRAPHGHDQTRAIFALFYVSDLRKKKNKKKNERNKKRKISFLTNIIGTRFFNL